MSHAHAVAYRTSPAITFPERTARRARSRYLISPRAILVSLAIAASLLVMTSVRADVPQPVAEYVVQPGDTLWEIASGIAGPGADVRETVASLQSLNDMAGSMLHPGQVLLLPAG